MVFCCFVFICFSHLLFYTEYHSIYNHIQQSFLKYVLGYNIYCYIEHWLQWYERLDAFHWFLLNCQQLNCSSNDFKYSQLSYKLIMKHNASIEHVLYRTRIIYMYHNNEVFDYLAVNQLPHLKIFTDLCWILSLMNIN